MDFAEVFRANLPLINRVIERVCHRARLYGADADDFASEARLALLANDYAILRKHEGRSSLGGYLAVVIQNVLHDYRGKALGKWRPSAEAERLGPAGTLLERLIRRDRRPLEAAIPLVRSAHPELSPRDIEVLAARLPERAGRPTAVHVDEFEELPVAAAQTADDLVLAHDLQQRSERAAAVMRDALEAMSTEDRALVHFRFARDMTIADIARLMQLPQRPLYRRLEALLARLRDALVHGGIDAREAAELIGGSTNILDFGLRERKTDRTVPSSSGEESG